MPSREFLEKYPLYRRFKIDVPEMLKSLDTPPIHMNCEVCVSDQTFRMTGYTLLGSWGPGQQGNVISLKYRCASCDLFLRFFLVKFDPIEGYALKVGQEPPWDISIDRTLERALGKYVGYYRKGLTCESHSYGIAAFSYYRRIVEQVIDKLLDDIADLIGGEEKQRYLEALERAKQATITQDKIELVKDLLPPILRPDNMNPLSVLHNTLSRGLHRESDEECLELAETTREILVFLVNQVATSRATACTFTASMRRLLNRRSTTMHPERDSSE